jgi:aromatase
VPAFTDNRITIAAPFDVVWDMTNDIASWPSLFTEYATTEILAADEESITFRLTTVPDADGQVWSWVSRRTPDRAGRCARAERIELGPFQFMRLRWDYTEVAGGISMRWRQEFSVSPGLPFDDAAMKERLDRTSREQMAHIKQVVEASVATGHSQEVPA